ncbi:unnamed protein product, partial [Vitrella brassicaformis CCMP3155]
MSASGGGEPLSSVTSHLFTGLLLSTGGLTPSEARQMALSAVSEAARDEGLPDPDSLMDSAGNEPDYQTMCPADWIDQGDGKHCIAPATYTGSCNGNDDFSLFTPRTKNDHEERCGTQWPKTGAKCARDYSYSCPQGWVSVGGERCRAPPTYRGPCIREADFTGHDERLKAVWASECGVSWPCRVACEPDFSIMCPLGWAEVNDTHCTAPAYYRGRCGATQPVGLLSDEEKHIFMHACEVEWPCDDRQHMDLTHKCPLGWTSASDSTAACTAPPHYKGPCASTLITADVDQEGKYRLAVRCHLMWPPRAACDYDFTAECPLGWRKPRGSLLCLPTDTVYSGPCATRVDFSSFTPQMKAAWAAACNAPFPCRAFIPPQPSKRPARPVSTRVSLPDIDGPIRASDGAIIPPNVSSVPPQLPSEGDYDA